MRLINKYTDTYTHKFIEFVEGAGLIQGATGLNRTL